MDFNFTEEQDMVRDGLSRLVREQYDWETRRAAIESDAGWRPEIWAQLAELGILGMPFSEDVGGFGGGAIDAMIVMEEFGKGLVVEHVLAAGDQNAMTYVLGSLGQAERPDVPTNGHTLGQLGQLGALKESTKFRLAEQHDLEQLLGIGLQVGQKA